MTDKKRLLYYYASYTTGVKVIYDKRNEQVFNDMCKIFEEHPRGKLETNTDYIDRLICILDGSELIKKRVIYNTECNTEQDKEEIRAKLITLAKVAGKKVSEYLLLIIRREYNNKIKGG